MLTVLRRLFSFSDYQVNHPGSPPPGDMLDASFDAQNQRIAELESLLDSVRRSDGRLQNGIVSKDSLDPQFFVSLSAKIAQIGEILLENARLDAQKAENAAQTALFAQNSADDAKNRVLAVESDTYQLHARLQEGLRLVGGQLDAAEAAAAKAEAAAEALDEAESYSGYSEAWARTSAAWAEHMPDTIPDNFMQATDVSGDHWSSRWWANRAAHSFGVLVELYLGAHPNPPTTGNDGGPIDPGSIYYDTDDGRAYVWTGTAWVPLWTPAQSNTLSLWYAAAGGQTAFPTSTPDVNGNSFVIDAAHPQGVEVHVNGLLKEPDLSGPDVGDYTISPATSTITFNVAPGASARVAIDIMMAPDDMRPGAMNAWAMTVSPAPDGILTAFTVDVIDASGPPTATVGKAEELLVSVDGVLQKPGDDYQASAATLTFSTAPAADSIVFVTWFQALGGSPTGDMTPAEILAAIKTVDGSGSGIDADLLDGLHAAAFEPALPGGGTTSTFLRGDKTWAVPAGGGGGVTDGDKGDIVVSASGATWLFDSAVVTAAAKTLLDDATVANMKVTLGLGNVDNTADTAKPVSTAQAAADALNVLKAGDTMTGPLVMPVGSAAATSINFGQANYGFYGSTNNIIIAGNGAARITVTANIALGGLLRAHTAGSAATPAISFNNDTDAGLYCTTAGDVRMAMAGADVLKFLDDKSATFSGQVLAPAGSAAAPSYSFSGTPDMGIYATGNMQLVVGGAIRLTLSTTAVAVGTGLRVDTAASTTTRSGLRVPAGTKPTAPGEGDIWSTTAGGFYGFINGVAKNLSIHVGTTAPSSPITNDLWLDIN